MSSSAGAGPSKRRGQYSSRACNACRRRRCKCDGAQPVCGACGLYGRECDWSNDTDARRPVTKQLIEGLRTKIQQLEAEVERLRGDPAAVAPRNLTTEPSADPNPAAPRNASQRYWELNKLQSELGYIPDAERPPPLASHFTATVMYRYIFQIDSTLPALEQSNDARLSLVCDWSRHLPQLPDVTFSRQEHDLLLLRCFKYGTSWLLGLVPELFLHDMLYSLTAVESETLSQPRLQHYSPLLHCAIMAFATAFSDDPAIRAPATRAQFASCAKRWLDEEFKQPAMSLVRSLALLAEYHCGIGERDTGYMYMGMSFRAVHVFASKGDSEVSFNEAVVTVPESITRDWHYWSAFSYDKLMVQSLTSIDGEALNSCSRKQAIEYDKDYDIPIPFPEVSLPSSNAEMDNQSWPPEPSSTPSTVIPLAKLTTLVFHESSKLMIIAARIINVVRLKEINDLEEHVIINMHLRLDTWFNALPEKLLVWARSTAPLPHLILLHICYWSLLILLHQSQYPDEPGSGKAQDKTIPSSAARMPITDLSIKMCDRAAHKIVQLVKMYDEQHGLKFFPRNAIEAICTCGSALIREYALAPPTANKKRATAVSGVMTCVSALRAMTGTWPCAEARADDLEQRLQGRINSFVPVPQLDGPTTGGQIPDDGSDISDVFYQYMHERSQSPELGSESSFGPGRAEDEM
ncbi:hypothetical protein FRC07_005792 [Ceratobasidium sp. 392]|nr:hypothetical protein FRC07_005792 [Ceratobasidium sp. 392]